MRLVAAILPIALYLLYVDRYAVNALWEDDWSRVPMLDGFFHGHAAFGLLWAQDNEQRLLLPNAIFVVVAHVDHFNTKAVVLLGAAIFCASYICILAAQRRIWGALPRALPLLLLGLVWFSIADDESALWAIQFAWYVVLGCLCLLLLALTARQLSWPILGFCLLVATAASYSSLQGLMLWPVGFLCIAWRTRATDGARRQSPRVLRTRLAAWVAGAVAVTLLYFVGYHFNDLGQSGSVTYVIHHPAQGLQYFLLLLGNVFPTHSPYLVVHTVVGAAVLAVAVLAVVTELRTSGAAIYPLTTALVLFAVLFDVYAAIGRVSFGPVQALSSRYTMANLLIVVAIILFVYRSRRGSERPAATTALSVALVPILALQVATSTHTGLDQTRAIRNVRLACARTTANLSAVKPRLRVTEIQSFCYPSTPALLSLLPIARSDQLAQLGPGARQHYRELGPP